MTQLVDDQTADAAGRDEADYRYRGHPTFREMVAAHLEAPNGPEDLRQWLLNQEQQGFAGEVREREYFVRETVEYLWTVTTIAEWLSDSFAATAPKITAGTLFDVSYDQWSYIVGSPSGSQRGTQRRYQGLPSWAVRFHRHVSDLLNDNKSRRWHYYLPSGIAMVALTLAKEESLAHDSLAVPSDRLALLDFAVMTDGTVHALYPNQFTAYTVCEQYVLANHINMRGRCRQMSAYLALAPLATDWAGQFSPCPACQEMVARQVQAGGLAERSFVTVAQLEDPRVPVDFADTI